MSMAFVAGGRRDANQQNIQEMLDENTQLIQAIADYQNKGKAMECLQYQELLHKNLVYLATLADSNQNSQALLPALSSTNSTSSPGNPSVQTSPSQPQQGTPGTSTSPGMAGSSSELSPQSSSPHQPPPGQELSSHGTSSSLPHNTPSNIVSSAVQHSIPSNAVGSPIVASGASGMYRSGSPGTSSSMGQPNMPNHMSTSHPQLPHQSVNNQNMMNYNNHSQNMRGQSMPSSHSGMGVSMNPSGQMGIRANQMAQQQMMPQGQASAQQYMMQQRQLQYQQSSQQQMGTQQNALGPGQGPMSHPSSMMSQYQQQGHYNPYMSHQQPSSGMPHMGYPQQPAMSQGHGLPPQV